MERHRCHICGKEGKYYPHISEYNPRQQMLPKSLPHRTKDGRGTYGERVWICAGEKHPHDWRQDRSPCMDAYYRLRNEMRDDMDARERAWRRHAKLMHDMKAPFLDPIAKRIVKVAERVNKAEEWLVRLSHRVEDLAYPPQQRPRPRMYIRCPRPKDVERMFSRGERIFAGDLGSMGGLCGYEGHPGWFH